MCKLIWWAAGCHLASPGGMEAYIPEVELPSGLKVTATAVESNYSSIIEVQALENGAVFTDTSSAMPDFREPVFVDPRSRFPAGIDVRPWIFGNWYKSSFADKKESLQLVGLGVRFGTGPSIEAAVGNSTKEVKLNGTFLRVRTDDDSELANVVPGRLRTAFQGSEIAFKRASRWIEECNMIHGCASRHSCPNTEASASLPTRVLHVGKEGNTIRLVESNGKRDHYVALSHCWGISHRITTRRETLQLHMDGISLDNLPPTFRDAIKIARKLEVPFVWIDSLCTIQGDALDWEMEASKMGDVYANSYLTVSALGSEDDSTGCFWEATAQMVVSEMRPYISCDTLSLGRRCTPLTAPFVADYAEGGGICCMKYNSFGITKSGESRVYLTREWMPSSQKRQPKSYLVGQFGRPVDPFEHEPLNKRCWTLQERLLSPRTLHYGPLGMYWECKCCVLAEDGAFLTRDFPTMANVLEARRFRVYAQESENEAPNERKWPSPWLRLIEEYTRRNLTMEEDKLPALSGLATYIASQTGDTYCAGLWRRDILQCLCWSIETFEPHHHCDDSEHDRSMPDAVKSSVRCPSNYRAPTWSWASLDGKVKYSPLDYKNLHANCLEVQVDPAGKDQFGKVKSGRIRLEGPFYIIREAKADEERQKNPFTVPVEICGSEITLKGSANFDLEPYFPSFGLWLDGSCALILKVKGPGIFNRIGTVHIYAVWPDHNKVVGARSESSGSATSEGISCFADEIQVASLANGSTQTVTIV